MKLIIELIKHQLDINKPTNAFDPLYCFYNKLVLPFSNKKSILYELNDLLYHSFLMNDERRNTLLDDFCKVIKKYNAFSRLGYLYKIKKMPVMVDHDLYLNPITYEMKNSIVINDNKNNATYLFLLRDLIKIINTSLSNSCYLFPEPVDIKNPYNNIPFTKSQLYNIYFALKKSDYAVPELFYCYFYSNFNLELYSQNYEAVIRTKVIKQYVNKTSYELLHQSVISMIYFYAPKRLYDNIHDDFPEKKLVDLLRPYLHLYFLGQGHIGIQESMLSHNCINLLKKKLRIFYKRNPKFGRKYIHIVFKNGKLTNEIRFDDQVKT